jgi:hypothetical protein
MNEGMNLDFSYYGKAANLVSSHLETEIREVVRAWRRGRHEKHCGFESELNADWT